MKNIQSYILCLLCFITCKNNESEKKETSQIENTIVEKHKKSIDSSKLFLQNACMVFRLGNDVSSTIFSLMNKNDKRFSHCGIAYNENNQWYVYHAIGGEDNPEEKLRKDNYETFVRSCKNKSFGIALVFIKQTEVVTLKKILDSLYAKQVPFDMDFDLKSDQKLYCAELLYKSYRWATNDTNMFKYNKKEQFEYVTTENLIDEKKVKMLCHVVYR